MPTPLAIESRPWIGLICAATLVAGASGCISNHHFADRGGALPDAAALARARQALEPASSGSLIDLTWIPLVTLQAEHYGSSDVTMRDGMTLTEIEAYGPLVMIGRHDRWLFDDDDQLYERDRRSHFGWGLWSSEQVDVRVPSGWRSESRTSLLFGLLRWPSTYYFDRLPGAPDDTATPAAAPATADL